MRLYYEGYIMSKLRYIFLGIAFLFSSQVFSQIDHPDSPVFISASIIPESNPTSVILNWSPSDSLDVQGYIVYQVISGVTETIDTVWGRLSTTYEYNMSSIITKPEQFRLAAFDDLFYKSSITDPHTTMFLSLEYDKCNTTVKLEWTNYSGWDNGLNSFKIYRRTETSNYTILSSLSSTELSYEDNDIDFNEKYYYYVEATSNSGNKATTNSVEILTGAYSFPSYMHAQYATVNGENIVVNFLVDNSSEAIEYRIQRANSPDGNFSTIQSYPNSGQNNIMHTDYDVNVDENRYYYRLASVNPCGIIDSYSSICSNILITVTNDNEFQHNVSWTDYYAWPNGVSNYKVYRFFNGTASEIAVNTPGNTASVYNIEWYVDYCHDRKIHMTNEFCYYVEAIESESPEYADNMGVSRSNMKCVNHYPVVWMPNAFNATSFETENREFKPVLSFVEKEPYEFVIYNRFGEEFFRTTETYEGWNGTINHINLAPSQFYTYFLRYYDHTGKEHQKTGTFFLFID